MKTISINSKWLSQGDSRIDASFHLSDGLKTIRILSNSCPYPIIPLSEEVSALFKGDIHKRVYVSSIQNGTQFYTASDLLKISINNPKLISKKYSPHIESLKLEKGWILITRSGTLGKVVLTNNHHNGTIGTDDILRIKPNENKILKGVLYAYLTSKYGYGLLTQSGYGGVIQHIEPHHIENLPIPNFPKQIQIPINDLINKSTLLREKSLLEIKDSQNELKAKANLPDLHPDEFEYFGSHSQGQDISTFIRNISEINSLSINAFNYSKKIEKLEKRVKTINHLSLSDCLDDNNFFSTGSFKRLELDSPNSIRLINQSDIFNFRKEGKMLARMFAKADKLVEYGEVIIAGVGTLGEGETFCRVIFANEELSNQLISGEFIRMKTSNKIPSGYLYSWLSSDYGFRFIRKTQTGTKLCRPIQELLKNIPVPILDAKFMLSIDEKIKRAHTMLFEALNLENQAIQLIEKEVESWQKL